ncbi:hypothetical protein RAA17_01040 [Komagataeibacter rhaeticus]|nr:hypothetical protein [Komagataeibacter rhaeticus]
MTLARMAATVLAQARAQAGREANLSTRLEMGWCAAYLEILARELVAHARFSIRRTVFMYRPVRYQSGRIHKQHKEWTEHDNQTPAARGPSGRCRCA